MPIATAPRRATSTATTITVNSTATALSTAAAALASNSFDSTSGVGFTGNSLMTRSAHPLTGFQCNVLEDGSQNSGYQLLGYSGKGCYDPTSRRVLFMGSGAGGNSPGGYVRNTVSRYTESTNTWDAPQRGYRAPGDSTNRNGMVHQYDSNCINVAARKLYHKFGSYNEYFVYDIDANSIGAYINGPASDISSSFWWPAMEFIPTRGTQGALWVLGWSSDNNLQMWEYDLAGASWSVLFSKAALGLAGNTFGAPVMSYNSRAFSGVGGVMLGQNSNVWTVNCSTLALTSRSAPPSGSIECSHTANGSLYNNSGFCRDPVGDGWLQFSDGFQLVYRWNGSTWETRATMPTHFSSSTARNFNVTPIDEYGVCWLISYEAGGGWLYRP